MSDENSAQTPAGDLEENISDSVAGQPEQDIRANSDSDEAWEKRSRLEEMYEVRERAKFMRWLGLEDDEAVALYHRMRLSTLAGDQAMLEETPSERIESLRAELESRLRRMPRFAFPEFRSRFRIGSRVKASSAIMENVGENADELARMLILSSEMIVRLSQKLDEQMDLHEALSARMDAARSMEDKAVESIPAWLVDAARMIEAMGFDRASLRSKGKEISAGFMEVLDRYADAEIGSDSVASRMSERLAHSIDAAQDDDDQVGDIPGTGPQDISVSDEPSPQPIEPSEDRSDIEDEAIFPMEAARSVPAGEASQDMAPGETQRPAGLSNNPVSASTPSAGPATTGRMASTFIASRMSASSVLDLAPEHARASGFAMIEGIDGEHGFEGFFSQFESGSASPVDASRMARMEERTGIDLGAISLVDGVLPDAAWMRYEVPYGDYAMVQMKGPSTVLPRLRDAVSLGDASSSQVSGMLPPFLSMARYGEMIGLPEKELRGLSAWDNQAGGIEHLRSSVMGGGRGDPGQAYEVMKRATAMHVASVLGSDEAARISPVSMDHMARFWLFLVIGRMRSNQLELMWPAGFFHGVEGHDVGLGNEGFMRLLRLSSGSIDAAI